MKKYHHKRKHSSPLDDLIYNLIMPMYLAAMMGIITMGIGRIIVLAFYSPIPAAAEGFTSDFSSNKGGSPPSDPRGGEFTSDFLPNNTRLIPQEGPARYPAPEGLRGDECILDTPDLTVAIIEEGEEEGGAMEEFDGIEILHQAVLDQIEEELKRKGIRQK
jgi:hypothetical protein